MKIVKVSVVLLVLLLLQTPTSSQQMRTSLTEPEASHFAALALKCIRREFPNKPEHVINQATDVQSPQTLHPAFYGCYDWHSSVHGHWMLVRLLKTYPRLPEAKQIRDALNANLSSANLRIEAEYMKQPNRQSFERTYGWAWLLKLAQELHSWDDSDGKEWLINMQPLSAEIVKSFTTFLPKQTYPIRTGVHPNSAFGLAFALDYARAFGDHDFEHLLEERSRTYFERDTNYPAAWEPGGEDFFSPALMEADLMRRVMKGREFALWFHKFLPGIAQGEPAALLTPAIVGDRTDPKLVHLDGLNLSRAWCMRNIAAAMPPKDPRARVLLSSAVKHADAALAHVASGDYAGEHWLASFAVLLLTLD